MTTAERIVHAILDDLGRRPGIRQVFDDVDAVVFEEMRGELEQVVKAELDKSVTVVELLSTAIAVMATRREGSANGDAKREFSIAITAAEDATMRYTRGRAHELDVFKPADLDARDAIEERHEWTGNALAAMDEREHGD